MDPIASALLQKALDGLEQRYAFAAQNIANANTPNYRPVHVTFEDNLREAATQGLTAINNVEPQTVLEPAADGTRGVRLDLELASASQTSMRYRALLAVLGQQMALERETLTGGR